MEILNWLFYIGGWCLGLLHFSKFSEDYPSDDKFILIMIAWTSVWVWFLVNIIN